MRYEFAVLYWYYPKEQSRDEYGSFSNFSTNEPLKHYPSDGGLMYALTLLSAESWLIVRFVPITDSGMTPFVQVWMQRAVNEV